MISRFVKEIHKHIRTKLETKTIRQTQSIENQFDPGTLTEALQIELEGNAQSGAKNHHCLSNRFQRTPQNWKQKSPKTRATKNQFDAGTMNHALETEMKPNSRIVSQNIIIARQSDSYIHHETGTKNHKDDSRYAKTIWCGTLIETKLTCVKRNAGTISYKMLSLCVKEIHKHITTKLETKTIRQTQSIENQFHAGTWTEGLQTHMKRNAETVSCEKSSLFVKHIPTDTTTLETKITKETIHKKSIWCRHKEPRTWNRIETEIPQSQLKHQHCSSERFQYTSRNWNQKSQRLTQST